MDMVIRAMAMVRVDGLREITMDMRRPEPAANVNRRAGGFRVSFQNRSRSVEPIKSLVGVTWIELSRVESPVGTSEAIQQLLLIAIPALILILVDPGPGKRP
jgi:hypothetical protein